MKPLATLRILVVEDERQIRMLMRIVLEAAGATVIEADDGMTALRLLELEAGAVDVVVTDLGMPRIDGVALVAELALAWPALPVVVCSAQQVTDHVPGLAERVQGIIHKPFVPSELVRIVHDAIGSGTPSARAAV